MQRVFSVLDSHKPGPLVIVVVALHGNEHVGFHGLQRLAEKLSNEYFTGKVVGITGNLAAANKKQRFITKDLNRFFLSHFLNEAHPDIPEWHEARGLIDAIDAQIAAMPDATAVHMLDVHSMSGAGTPFTCFPHTAFNEVLAHQLPLPAIADIVEILPGTLTAYYAQKLTSTMVVECGQHDADITKEIGEAAITSFLSLVGCLHDAHLIASAEDLLRQQTHGTDAIFTRVNYRYHIEHQGYFEMQPGFHNLQEVNEHQLMAHDREGRVHAPYTGRVVLPCYQKQGDDGFFIAVDED